MVVIAAANAYRCLAWLLLVDGFGVVLAFLVVVVVWSFLVFVFARFVGCWLVLVCLKGWLLVLFVVVVVVVCFSNGCWFCLCC